MRAIYCSIRCCTMNIVKTGRCGEAVGLAPHFARRGPVFTDSNGVTEAAFAGMGMALLRRSFIAPALTQGGWLILWRSPSPVRWPINWFTTRPRCWRLPTAVSRLAAWPAPGRC